MQASIRQRELCPLFSGGMQTSRAPLAQRRMISTGTLRIAAGGHRPEHIELTSRIDVVINDDDKSSVIGPAQRGAQRKGRGWLKARGHRGCPSTGFKGIKKALVVLHQKGL